ncbi:hypothetical protein Ate01nite_52830 [Actinoplanes teichomyceticus]|nr:hypothetical protein Ate01nite_52830 [Actinoplanes teichomyceticus]
MDRAASGPAPVARTGGVTVTIVAIGAVAEAPKKAAKPAPTRAPASPAGAGCTGSSGLATDSIQVYRTDFDNHK